MLIKEPYEMPGTKVLTILCGQLVCTSGGGLDSLPGYDDGGDPFAALLP